MNDIGVALFVYKRPQHTMKVLESIKNNGIEEIYIFQDGLKKEQDRTEWEAVTKIIEKINFVKVNFILSEVNKGLAESIIYGLNYMFKKFDKAIALEDDCLLGVGYFDFMKTCFSKYKKQASVMCISGNSFPIEIPKEYKYDVYFSYRMLSLGWGTWKDRWEKYTRDFGLLKKIKSNERKREILKKSGDDILPILFGQLEGKCDSWTIFWQLMQINNKGVCLYPTKSLAIDIGRDGSGTNTKIEIDRYEVDLYNGKFEDLNMPDKPIIDEDIIQKILEIINLTPLNERITRYNNILKSWLDSLYDKKTLEQYFTKNSIKKVYVYGTGSIANILLKEIINYASIEGFIVENKESSLYLEYNLYDMNDKLDVNNSLIIVIPSYDYVYIKNILYKNYKNYKIISLDELINKFER